MFKIDRNPQFTADVEVALPGDAEPQTLRTRFRAMPRDELDSFDLTTTDGTYALLEAAIVRFEDLGDEAGNPVPDTPALRLELLAMDWVRQPIVRAYFTALSGARLGN